MTLRELLRSEAALRFASGAIGRYLALCFRTTRWRLDLHPNAARPLADGAAIVAFWHERLPLMPMLWRLRRATPGSEARAHVLISRHRDGRLISHIVGRFGLLTVEGSSAREKGGRRTERGGAPAFRRLVTLLRAGDFVAVTPDGPRGPRREAAPGLGRLAELTGVPILPCAAATTSRLVLPTWDRLVLPVPFGRGHVVVGAPIGVGGSETRIGEPPIARALDDACARADAHARAAVPLAAAIWAVAASALAPALRLLVRRRLRAGKEIAGRTGERRGHAAGPRPPGRLVWIHAASLGELSSVLPVVEALVGSAPPAPPAGMSSVLLTTATASAAGLAARWIGTDGRASAVHHRMIPFDVPRWVSRFLDGWRPDAAVFVESELWPNAVRLCRRRGIALALLNARLSDRSARLWARVPGFAGDLLAAFDPVWARSAEDAARLGRFGVRCQRIGDLKASAPPLPVDHADLVPLSALLAGRPRWLAASTHEGEEAIAARVHARLASRHPGLLTIIAPRHPGRGEAIASALGGAPRRALGDRPPDGSGIWIADTLGELGLLYRLAPVVFLGRSLGGDGGGQNPWEPARLGCAIVTGAATRNFREPVRLLGDAGGLTVVPGEDELVAAIDALLSDPRRAAGQGEAAAAAAGRAASGLVAEAAGMVAALGA